MQPEAVLRCPHWEPSPVHHSCVCTNILYISLSTGGFCRVICRHGNGSKGISYSYNTFNDMAKLGSNNADPLLHSAHVLPVPCVPPISNIVQNCFYFASLIYILRYILILII